MMCEHSALKAMREARDAEVTARGGLFVRPRLAAYHLRDRALLFILKPLLRIALDKVHEIIRESGDQARELFLQSVLRGMDTVQRSSTSGLVFTLPFGAAVVREILANRLTKEDESLLDYFERGSVPKEGLN